MDPNKPHQPEWHHPFPGGGRPHRPVHGYHHYFQTPEEIHRQNIKNYTTWAGIGLCVVLFFYLTQKAKKALAAAQVEQELRDREEDGMGLLRRSSDDEEV